MLEALPYDLLARIAFGSGLAAADVGSMKIASKALNRFLSAEFDTIRHHALGGIRHCLDDLRPDAVLHLVRHLGADPTVDQGRAVRVAIRTGHGPLFLFLLTALEGNFNCYSALKFAVAANAEWAIRPLLKFAVVGATPLDALRDRCMLLLDLLQKRYVSPRLLAEGLSVLEEGVVSPPVRDDHTSLADLVRLAALLVHPKLFECAESARRFAAAPLRGVLTHIDSLAVPLSSRYVVKLARAAGEEPGRYPGFMVIFRLLLDLLPARGRSDLGYALVGVGRADLAEEAVGPAAFKFVIGPSTPEQILAHVGQPRISAHIRDFVRHLAPAEVLARLVEGVTPEELNQPDLNWVLPEAMARPVPEARAILLAALPPAARESRRATVDQMLELKEEYNIHATSFRFMPSTDAYSTIWVPVRFLADPYYVPLALQVCILHYKTAFMGTVVIRDRSLFRLGFIGAPLEIMEMLCSAVSEGKFNWAPYYEGRRTWRENQTPADIDYFRMCTRMSIFSHRHAEFASLDEVWNKAVKWDAACRSAQLDNGLAPESSSARIALGVAEWAIGRKAAGLLSIEDVVALDLFFKGQDKVIDEWGGISVLPRLVPELAKAGVNVFTSRIFRLAPCPTPIDPCLNRVEYRISDAWPGLHSPGE